MDLLKCKQCGGNVVRDDKNGIYYCKYCNSSYFIDDYSTSKDVKPIRSVGHAYPVDQYVKIPLSQIFYLPLYLEDECHTSKTSLEDYLAAEFIRDHMQWLESNRIWMDNYKRCGKLWGIMNKSPREPIREDYSNLMSLPSMWLIHLTERSTEEYDPCANYSGNEVFADYICTSSTTYGRSRSQLYFINQNDWNCSFYTKAEPDEIDAILAHCDIIETKKAIIRYANHCEHLIKEHRASVAQHTNQIKGIIKQHLSNKY